eukprot:gnl/TRDRNA2_/TRDRNA2_179973_c0_seq1.p1 gnl/TRDRNA2_/TRDRNA2_179973_c0~~gnl/TRDRNA2_/TRDRNA2_179973_c0_seq1.p1  ORF type:complete len:212 (-),score=59.40 gnl/TRDRNA2_/TRDRNA2_179973_c0_seq1:91-726(-)
MVLHVKKAVELLRELKRSRWLPAYQDRVIKDCLDEIHHDHDEFHALGAQYQIAEGDLPEGPEGEQVVAGLWLYNDCIERNKRCLLVYLLHRLRQIEQLRWEVGLMVPQTNLDKLHESEKQYLHLYNSNLDKYMKHCTPAIKEPLDLTANATPPYELNVQIKVPEGVGDVVTADSGTLQLKKGWVHFAKKSDVEHLIRAGKVVHVKTLRDDD